MTNSRISTRLAATGKILQHYEEGLMLLFFILIIKITINVEPEAWGVGGNQLYTPLEVGGNQLYAPWGVGGNQLYTPWGVGANQL